MYSLIADGQYRRTSLGRDTWKSLIGSEASLQSKCNKEGFNAVSAISKYSKPGSVSLVTTPTLAIPVTLELGLVLEDYMMIPTHAETRVAGSTSRQWDIFWCSKKKLIFGINLHLAPNESVV